ncbi:unnamed protein product [Peniophora sp. CBMAI 1063]|nr:unnamed protein product [Peniophora sp. CBMAI 1063]
MPEPVRFFSQHVPLLDPLSFDDALCFDARLEPALHADLRNGPDVRAVPVDRESGVKPGMRGVVRGLRYGDGDTDECSFFWNEVKDFTTSMLYILPGASHLWVNATYIPPKTPHLLHDNDLIHLHSPSLSQPIHTRFIYRHTPFLGCPNTPLAFDVLGKLGSGSSGVVKECRDQHTGERVAVKVIKAQEGSSCGVGFCGGRPREYAVLRELCNPEAVERYLAESGLEEHELAVVRCRALWFDKRRKEHHVVYPLARTDLDQIVTTNGRLSERTARSVAKQLCTALRYLHASQIVHCDVKPGNILITGPGPTPAPHDDLRVVLADFGYALWEHEIPSVPRAMGTRGCKAPESTNFKKCGSAIDMFALGATIFFALTGRFPYGYKDPGEIIIDARQLSVWPLLESVGVSAAGQDWIARALLLEPRERMSADEGLRHAWIGGGELVKADLGAPKEGGEQCAYAYDSDTDSEPSQDSDDDEDEDGVVTCYACGAKRRRAGSDTGSETLEGSEQEAKDGKDVDT